MRTVAFCTLGCKVNQYESNAMEKMFKEAGYKVVPFSQPSDVYIVNTCTVTGVGDKKSRQMLRRAKKNNKNSIVAAVGCMAQVALDDVSGISEVDVILGTNQKQSVVESVEKALKDKMRVTKVEDVMGDGCFEEMPLDAFESKERAYVKIQDGCNKFCSYCIIPYARGHIRSRDMESIKAETMRLADNGFTEITLAGIHVASYGLKGKHNLTDAIEMVSVIEKIQRIRLSSIDPLAFTDAFIEKICSIPKLCPHFHISLQSGSDLVLKHMNRRYTTNKYQEIIEKLRKRIPDVSITTDIITGFPYETDEEFNKTHSFLEEIKLSGIHVFPYSERQGTPAAEFSGKVPKHIRDLRAGEIIKLAQRHKSEYGKRFVGTVLPVLFEESGKDGFHTGFTPHYVKVKALTKKEHIGKIIPVKIINEVNGELLGEI